MAISPLFDLRDYTVEEGTLEDPRPRQIPGLIKRTLVLRNGDGAELVPTQAPVATRFCLQSEMVTQDGDPSFIKAGVRVMLAVPVQSSETAASGDADESSSLASLVFGVRTDGTLAQIDDLPQETLLQESNQDILLPADLLQQVRPISGNREGDPDTDARPSFTFDGVDDYIDVGHDRTLSFTRNFSIEAWVWPAVEQEQWIFAKQGSYGLGLADGNPVFTTYEGQRYQMEEVSIPTETWTHLAVVLDRRNTLRVYVNGELTETFEGVASARPSQATAKIGGQDPQSEAGFWAGLLSEVRVWNTALVPEEIQQRMADRLLGREAGLVGYWPLMSIANGETVDFSPASNTGTVFGAFPSGRRLPRRVGRRNVDAYRYGEVFSVVQGATYLETFEYRTDAPILPFDASEEAFNVVEENYDGAAAVQLTSTEDISFSWTRSQESGFGFDIEAVLGVSSSVEVGFIVMTEIDAGVGLTGNIAGSYSLLNEGTTTLDISNVFQDRLALRGELESPPQFPHLGRRYVPKNVGYALVASSLADVFVLRLQRSRRMVSYQVAPVPDLPPQVNTITFLMNPAYRLNGSLDGQVGTAAAEDRFYGQVPEQRAQFGSQLPASYFRLQEAAQLQAEIRRQDREREALFINYKGR